MRHYAAKGCGISRIKGELARRGIEKELWDEALEEMPETDGIIDKLLKQKLKDPADKKQVDKAVSALYRRGYSGDEIRRALSRYADESVFDDE